MPVVTQFLTYGLYFNNPADGIAAQAANGGSLNLAMAPDTALATFPVGSQILNLGIPFFNSVPGTVDLGGYTPSSTTPGIVHSPRFISTGVLSTVTTDTVYASNGSSIVIVQTNTVTWIWTGTIIYTHIDVVQTSGVPTGIWEQQIITYTGDGTAGRLIPTTFPLNSGVVAVWICSKPSDATNVSHCFRHNGIGMTGTAVLSSSTVQANGITSFGAGGFTVSAGNNGLTQWANRATDEYTAIVLRDTTSDNRFMRVSYDKLPLGRPSTDLFRSGSYIGTTSEADLGDLHINNTVTWRAAQPLYIVDIDQLLFVETTFGFGTFTFNWSSSVLGFWSGSGLPNTNANAVGMSFTPVARPLSFPGSVYTPTHTWIWGRDGTYRSTDFTGDSAVVLSTGANPVTGLMTSQTNIGTNIIVNNTQVVYNCISLNGLLLAGFFKSWKVTGAGSPPTTVTGLGFTPAVAFARRYTTSSTGAVWRGSTHTGTTSNFCEGAASQLASTGITALGSGTVDLGTEVAASGIDSYGWAFAGSGSIPSTPTFTPTTPTIIDESILMGPVTLGMSAADGGANSTTAPPIIIPGPGGGVGDASAIQKWWNLHRFDIKPRPEEKS